MRLGRFMPGLAKHRLEIGELKQCLHQPGGTKPATGEWTPGLPGASRHQNAAIVAVRRGKLGPQVSGERAGAG